MMSKKEMYDIVVGRIANNLTPLDNVDIGVEEKTNRKFGCIAKNIFSKDGELWFEWNNLCWRYARNERAVRKTTIASILENSGS